MNRSSNSRHIALDAWGLRYLCQQNLSYIAAIFLLTTNVALNTAAPPDQPEPSSSLRDFETVDHLLEQLGAPSFETREAATKRLKQLLDLHGLPLWQHLSAIQNQSPEVRSRMKRLFPRLNNDGPLEFTICDWCGSPLSDAWCVIYELPAGEHEFSTDGARIGYMPCDAKGVIRPPAANQRQYCIAVHTANAKIAGFITSNSAGRVRLPIGLAGSAASQRAARGKVVDHTGNPVPGVIVATRSVGLQSGSYQPAVEAVAITNEDGAFQIYNPPAEYRKKLLPIGTVHHLQLRHRNFFPHAIACDNRSDHTIELNHGDAFHRLQFAGRTAESAGVYSVTYTAETPNAARVALPQSYLRHGGRLRHGTYRAEAIDVVFQPFTVGPLSPRVINFDYSANPSFSGMVFEGISGAPIENAVVIARRTNKEGNLIDISNEQWQSLQDAEPSNWRVHPTVAALDKVTDVLGMARTDRTGRYRLELDEPIEVYSLLTVAPGMLPFEVRAISADDSESGQSPIRVSDMYHFPAATVTFRTSLPQTSDSHQRSPNLWPHWQFEATNQPEWFSRFRQANQAKHGLTGFYPCHYWSKVGTRTNLNVPANLRLRLRLTTNAGSEWSPLVFPDILCVAETGQQDLGNHELSPTTRIQVRVMDNAGEPLEGVEVRPKYQGMNAWNIGTTTDSKGIATLSVASSMPGEFGIIQLRGDRATTTAGNLRTPFSIAQILAQKEFKLQLTEAQVQLLPSHSEIRRDQ